MAGKKLDTAYEATKDTQGFWVNPTEIEVGVNFARRNAEPGHEERIVALAYNIYTEKQQTPVKVRKVGSRLVMVAGFGRNDAVNLIRAGFEYQGERYQDADRKLFVIVDENIKSDLDAAKASVLENVRKEVSPINMALAQQDLIEKGMTLTQIANLCNQNNTNSVSANLKLLQLPAEEQKLVHTGKLSRDAALKLQALPEEKKAELVAEAKEGKVTAAVVTDVLAEIKEKKETTGGGGKAKDDGDDKEEKEKDKYAPRNAAALKKFINEDIIGNESVRGDVQAVFAAVVKYLEGKNTGKTIMNRIAEVK